MDVVERSVVSYGGVQAGYLEKGCSWITLFIAMAPSLGFLGTVIGMVMAFDNIQRAGDISPTVVAGGMENMSMAPYAMTKARFGYRMNNATIVDTMVNDALTDAFNHYHMDDPLLKTSVIVGT